ncbi:MAG: zinc metalloprotease HtpX [Ignisphaera sp.]
MKEKALVIISLAIIAVFTFMLMTLIVSLIAPGFITSIGLAPFWWPWFLVDIMVYIMSITVLLMVGSSIGKVIEKRVPVGLDHLKASIMTTSVGVISGATLMFLLIAYLLGTELAGTLFVMALLFAFIPSFISWLIAPAIINVAYRCRYDPEIQEIVNRVSLRAGMKPPKAMIAHLPIPNAFAYSSPLMGKYIAVTTGLLQVMGRNELEAVIGHELGHHKHKDNMIMMLFGIIPTAIYFLGRFLMFSGLAARYADGSGNRRSTSGGLIFVLLGAVLIVLSIIVQIIVLSLSRLREYYADAHGAKVSSPNYMINALKSLDKFYRSTGAKAIVANSRLKPLFIYALTEPFVGLEELLSSHPPVYKRIAFLETLLGREITA